MSILSFLLPYLPPSLPPFLPSFLPPSSTAFVFGSTHPSPLSPLPPSLPPYLRPCHELSLSPLSLRQQPGPFLLLLLLPLPFLPSLPLRSLPECQEQLLLSPPLSLSLSSSGGSAQMEAPPVSFLRKGRREGGRERGREGGTARMR